MLNTFYISESKALDGTWYMLLLKDTHFCISSGNDLDKVLQVLKSYVKRYRTKDRLYTALDKMSYGSRVSPSVFEDRKEDFKERGDDYDDLIRRVVRESLDEVLKEEKENSPLKKTRTRLKKAGVVHSPKTPLGKPLLENKSTKSRQEILKKRPRVFKMH